MSVIAACRGEAARNAHFMHVHIRLKATTRGTYTSSTAHWACLKVYMRKGWFTEAFQQIFMNQAFQVQKLL